MNDLFTIPLQENDLDDILELFSISFNGRIYSKDYYQWRVLLHPSGLQLVELCKDQNNRLASHYAVCPAVSFYRGAYFTSALSLVTMTHPDYAGKGLFPKLADLLYSRMSSENHVQLVYGFPNTNSHYSFVTKLGWNDVYLVPTLKKSISLKDTGPFEWVSEGYIDERFDSLWKTCSDTSAFFYANARSAAFLRWRFMARPENTYIILSLSQNDRLGAYAVVKTYAGDNGTRELDLVDYLLSDSVSPAFFFSQLSAYAQQHHFSCINSWIPYSSGIYKAAEKNGFMPQSPITYLGYKIFNLQTSLPDMALPSNWYLTMADSDVY